VIFFPLPLNLSESRLDLTVFVSHFQIRSLTNLPSPQTWSDLRQLIRFIGFYQQWIQQFALRISPFRQLQHRQPLPTKLTLEEEQSFFKGFWLPPHKKHFRELVDKVISGPTLQRPDTSRRLYVKTDWSKDGIGAVLLQANTNCCSRTNHRHSHDIFHLLASPYTNPHLI
jgi:RNase H-like domain found in reverse transcriptase